MNIIDAPQWIRENYSYTGNMGSWADKLENALKDIEPYVEDGFCDNHFRRDLDKNRRWKKLSEGMWHLHVLWSLNAKGIKLQKPDTNDDILVIDQDVVIGVETTFSSWGHPKGSLALTHSTMGREIVEVSQLSADIVDQAINVLNGKNDSLVKRQPQMPRIVVLNEASLANGFQEWNGETEVHRRQGVFDIARRKNYQGMVGFTYDYISYSDYFSKSRLTLCPLNNGGSYLSIVITESNFKEFCKNLNSRKVSCTLKR